MNEWQLPRVALIWLFVSLLLVVMPLFNYLPIWVFICYGVCIFWRYQMFVGKWPRPFAVHKLVIVLLGFSLIYLSFKSFVGLESASAMLIAGVSFKLLEASVRREFILLCFLALLIVAVNFLYSQSFFYSLYLFLCLPVVLTALLSLHLPLDTSSGFGLLKPTTKILLQSLPLMLALFVVFPRFQPFWQITLPNQQAKVGVSDSLSPGDFSNLTRDESLAFRANFEGLVPGKSELYWRGVVLSRFDGRAWHQSDTLFTSSRYVGTDDPSEDGVDYRYSIIQEPSYRQFLFTLATADSVSDKVGKTSNYLLKYQQPIFERIAYHVTSDINQLRAVQLPRWSRYRETQLVKTTNPRAQQFAVELYEQSSSDAAYVDAVLSYFSNQNFYYSLNAPVLGQHNIDEFLFDERTGYCGHYASAFVYLMRAAGIPARVIGGYFGGEVNPLTGSVLVYQYDAHAWAEVWLPTKGWVRVDPTLQVAPDRVLNNVQDLPATAAEYSSRAPLNVNRFKSIAVINYLRLQLDAIDYHWAKMVLQYKGQNQYQFLHELLGEVTAWRIMLLLLFALLPVILWLLLVLIKNKLDHSLATDELAYQRLCYALAKSGCQRQSSEGPIEYVRRVEASKQFSGQSRLLSHIQTATRLFVALRYDSLSDSQRRLMLKQLKLEVRQAVLVLRKWRR